MKKILIIDDDRLILKSLQAILMRESYSVEIADDGLIGVQKALENPPDLIVCDVRMPNMDGYEVVAKLRHNPVFSLVPFLFLSANEGEENRRRGFRLGADDYILKPFKIDDLVSAIALQFNKLENIEKQKKSLVEELRFSLTRTLPHEFKTPIHGIIGFSELLKNQDYRSTLSADEVNEMIEEIHSAGKKLHDLIETYLLYSNLRMISGVEITLDTTQIEPNISIEEIAESFESLNPKISLRLELENPHTSLFISPEHFNILLREIISNAFKFSDGTAPVTITSSCQYDFYTISITNHGFSMEPEQIQRIGAFSQFNRDKNEQQGMGLGLGIVQEIIRVYQGTLKITSDSIKSTTVKFSLKQIFA